MLGYTELVGVSRSGETGGAWQTGLSPKSGTIDAADLGDAAGVRFDRMHS
jgi:hypothetical protein